jgi:hypothetical protein
MASEEIFNIFSCQENEIKMILKFHLTNNKFWPGFGWELERRGPWELG